MHTEPKLLTANTTRKARSWSPGLRDVQDALAALRMRALKSTSGAQPTWTFTESDDEWWHGQLARLEQDLRRLKDQIVTEERSVKSPEAVAKWEEAITAIAASEKYRGVKWPSGDRLTPQLGLVPIGQDPSSSLWEFSHLESGNIVVRAHDRTIVPQPDMGLVFVLLPGGRVPVEEGEHAIQEGELTKTDLDPFFLSKYEMTNEQWDRLDGWRHPGDQPEQQMLPVTSISWEDCASVLSRVAARLWLPTEAQWEYGCRAGSTTAWWTGNDPQSLLAAANICPEGKKAPGLLAVGSLRANPFGLHDVHGNVWEYCRDGWSFHEPNRQPGDGYCDPPDAGQRLLRGGGHQHIAADARSSERSPVPPRTRTDGYGLRPARVVTP